MIRFIVLLVASSVISCASNWQLLGEQNRELLIHPDKAGLVFPYTEEICKNVFLGIKHCKSEKKEIYYNLEDKIQRDLLINLGFSCRSTRAWK